MNECQIAVLCQHILILIIRNYADSDSDPEASDNEAILYSEDDDEKGEKGDGYAEPAT